MWPRLWLILQLAVSFATALTPGLQRDEGASKAGYILYTSKMTLSNDRFFQDARLLRGAATQGLFAMKALCKKETSEDGRLPSCPRAMTVFAIGNELYFSSSVKGKGLSRNNEFMTTLLLDSNFKDAEVSRVVAADRLQTSMLRCQARQRTVVDPVEHHHNARCGEFPSVFLYLAGQDDPETIDLSQGRIMTVGDGQPGDRWPPIYRPCPPTLQDSVQKYGCQDWIQQFGITRVLNGGDPQFATDPQQKTEHIPLCGLNPQ